jgi:predicted kinase
MIGIPASGKTSFAENIITKNDKWVRVSRDDFRFMLSANYTPPNKIESLITTLVVSTIRQALSQKLNVIVDQCNTKLSYINSLLNEFKYEADINYQIMDIDLDKAIQRDSLRDRTVGETDIKRMYKEYKNLLQTFDFKPVLKQNRPVLIPDLNVDNPAVIFDIDGTLAQMNGRGPFEWHRVGNDHYVHVVIEQIEFHKNKGRTIILVSGREDICKDKTEEWLNKGNIYYDHLFMRPGGNYDKDSKIKQNIFNNFIKPNYNVIAIYDDRLQVIDMWNKQGLFVFNVNQGNHIF